MLAFVLEHVVALSQIEMNFPQGSNQAEAAVLDKS